MSRATPRIVIATRLYAPEVGAASFRLRALARGLAASGATVRVVTTTPPPGSAPEPVDPGVSTARASVLRDAGGNVRGYVQYLSFDIPLFFRLLFARADLVVSEPPPTTGLVVAVTSWLHRRPYVYYAADVWTDGLIALGAPKPVVAVMRRVEGFVMRRAAAVIAVSDEVAEKVRSFGVAGDRVSSIGNGVDTEVFRPDGPVADTVSPTFVYTGAMSEWQGPTVFVEAMPRILEEYPTANIQFFGQGVEEPAIRATAERLGLTSVHVRGVIPPAETAQWIRGATAALASIRPGVGYDFAKPTKTYAAAACGTPVVFAGIGVGAQLVEENDLGWRAAFEPAAVADAMLAAVRAEEGGQSALSSAARVAWVRSNASIAATGHRAAEVVLDALRSRSRAR
ncbi:glycosyltransferase family 4 protein [Diaminobutyricibacter sp. McL0618]|uniref:glycosyltransferase family 4 protein n=1 Tax=Leifsonia sp. McL0618 TaxID=3415677 RepID=UPI003CEF6330